MATARVTSSTTGGTKWQDAGVCSRHAEGPRHFQLLTDSKTYGHGSWMATWRSHFNARLKGDQTEDCGV